jgi:hypothetical protein
MSYGFTAYESYVRIHAESGGTSFPGWAALPHIGRMAWEAAAQAVALAVLPAYLNPDQLDDMDDEAEGDQRPKDSAIDLNRRQESRHGVTTTNYRSR